MTLLSSNQSLSTYKDAGIINKVYFKNWPQFSMAYTLDLIDHRNDVIKCSVRGDSLGYCKIRYRFLVCKCVIGWACVTDFYLLTS